MKKYYSMVKAGQTADIDIYGDITSFDWQDSDVSSYSLAKELEEMGDVTQINVHINSYGGEVAEGLAIYNALKRHQAHVTTTCDGMACSIASVIFMAGDERVMYDSSLLMIHNAWSFASGNAADLRKQADDLDVITSASKAAYMSSVNIGEEELSEMMDAETWITPDGALEMGFATSVVSMSVETAPSQNARRALVRMLSAKSAETDGEDGEEEPEDVEIETEDGDGAENGPDGGDEGQDGPEEGDEEPEDVEIETEDGDGAENGPDGGDEGQDGPEEDDEESDEGRTEQKAAFAAFIKAIS